MGQHANYGYLVSVFLPGKPASGALRPRKTTGKGRLQEPWVLPTGGREGGHGSHGVAPAAFAGASWTGNSIYSTIVNSTVLLILDDRSLGA